MSEVNAVQALSSIINDTAVGTSQPPASTGAASGFNFGDLLADGLGQVENKVDAANEMVRAFATDSSVPIHHVTIALEEARMAVELAVQVRSRLVEGYREIMNMQL